MGQRKTETVKIYLAPKDRELLKARAARLGKNLSEYVRMRLRRRLAHR